MSAQAAARALARVSVGAVERNCAHLRSLLTGDAALCAVVKADGYGHGAVECARAAQRGGASWLAVATAGEAALLRAAGIDGAAAGDGRADARGGPRRRSPPTPTSSSGSRSSLARSRRGSGERPAGAVHVKLDTGMGRLGTADVEQARAVAEIAAADERLELVGLMTHFATADEPGDDHFPRQLARFAAFAEELRAAHPGLLVHAANSAATLPRPGEPLRHGPLRRRDLRPRPVPGRTRASTASSRRSRSRSLVGAVRRFEAGRERRLRPPLDGRRRRPGWPRCRSATATAGGAALTNDCDVLIGGRRQPLVGHGQHGQRHRRPRPDATTSRPATSRC